MKKNLAKKITMSILAGAMLMSSSVAWAADGAYSAGSEASASGNYSNAIGYKASASGNYSNAFGNGATASGNNSNAFGSGATASGNNSNAIGREAVANGKYSVALGAGSVTSDDYTVSIGSSGYERRLTNLAVGVKNTDAVNVKQLNEGLALKANASDVYTKSETDSTIKTAVSGKADKSYVDTELGKKADKADTLAGYGITDAYTKTEADGLLANKADKASVYTKTETDNKLDGKADKATTLAGYGITDAYTKTEIDGMLGGSNNAAIAGINQRLDKTNAKINKVGAGAAALAALHPLEYDPDDKLTFSAGMGNYAGENAAALGAFYRPNEKFMVSLGGTMGNGENMVNLGLSIGLDKPNGYAKLSKRELIQEVNAVKAENNMLIQKVDAVEAENEAIKAEMAEMKAMLQAIMAKK